MGRRWHVFVLGVLSTVAGMFCRAAEPPLPAGDAEQFFEQRVRPLLVARCHECHGPTKQESGLRLDSRESLLKGGDQGEPGAIAGNPDQSLLIRVLRHDGDIQMPPDARLSDNEIQLIAAWIQMGLPWPQSSGVAVPLSAAERARHDQAEHWAFQPVTRPTPRLVKNAAWISTGIDTFILAQLEARHLSPAPRADRRTLLRRLFFDLHGLPPDPEEIDAFERDTAPDAYARWVDRLLASPRYGERWGRHWLDVARYADTRGYAFAQERRYPYAYTYRDYVIGALNADKPYDRFIVEQLAADQLTLGDDNTPLAALGFLTTGRRFNNRQDDLDDQIDVVSRGLLGLTVACARCHDHKYDAVPAEDYYSLYGVFANCREPEELPLIGELRQSAAYAAFQQELAKHQAAFDQFRGEKHTELLRGLRDRAGAYLARVTVAPTNRLLDKLPFISLGKDELRPKVLERWRAYLREHARSDSPIWGPWSELTTLADDAFSTHSPPILEKWRKSALGLQAGQLHSAVHAGLFAQPITSKQDLAQAYGRILADAHAQFLAAGGRDESLAKLPAEWQPLAEIIAGKSSPTSVPLEEVSSYLDRADREKYRELQRKVQSFQATSPAAPPRAMVVQDNDRLQDSAVLIRGNPGRPGKTVPRQFLSVLAGPERQPFSRGSGRMDLALAIVDAHNPLTRRVIANRVWMHHFGQSLVRTPSDWGVRCEPPVHPELLDYLASHLLENGWSLKSLHREIVLSSAYQQQSTPANAGDRAASQVVVADPENRLFGHMNRRRLEFEPLRDALLSTADRLDLAMGGRSVPLTSAPFARRRTVYGFIDRQDLPNLLRVFDFASPDQSQAERPRTTVPQQALFLMNSPFVIEQAQALAARPEIARLSDATARIRMLYRLVFQREPAGDELTLSSEFLRTASVDGREPPSLTAWEQLAQLLLLTNEFCYVD